jgi:hypothetical protein
MALTQSDEQLNDLFELLSVLAGQLIGRRRV